MLECCQQGLSDLGLPSARDAYMEACRAPSPRAAQAWSHPAVYLAGRDSDWFFLANNTERETYYLWTVQVNERADYTVELDLSAIDVAVGAPVIIKLIEGTQGIGVLLAESVKQAESMIELLQSQKQNVLIQKFVAESKGKDVRAFVVGDQVVAAMRRVAQGQEFRSNVHRGGVAEAIELGFFFSRSELIGAR